MNRDRRELLEELCRSGRWVLWRATHAGKGATALVKLASDSAPELPALERELQFLRVHRCAGLPRGFAIEIIDDHAGLVFEDRGFRSLARLLETGQPLGVDAALSIGIAACKVLGVLHAEAVVHGSPGPPGILVSESFEEIELFDCSLATRAPASHAALVDTLIRADQAPFMAPEQTGRINRPVDLRTDLYALGATLYSVLTGHPPFVGASPLEILHSHITRPPDPPDTVEPRVPVQLSRIVMRLLAKSADERYQSAPGLLYDLERCRGEWREDGRVSVFELGSRDVGARLPFPARLYGRDDAARRITDVARTAIAGRPTLLLVSGYSGVGKTSLVRECCRPLVVEGGYFVESKFDSVARTVPHGGLVQALRSLLRQVLAGADDELAFWRQTLAHALGAHGGVVAALVPEVEFILGPQPVPAVLDALESQNRFRLVLQRVFEAFARPGHPLVLFLDDLQWADPATLNLLDSLLTDSDSPLFILGAFRDNEVTAEHPLTRTRERLEASRAAIEQVSLGPLSHESLGAFLGDTLGVAAGLLAPLVELVEQRTDGNPFFAMQFLEQLRGEGLLTWDGAAQRWTYRVADVASALTTDDAATLMVRRIQGLSSDAQTVLQTASCLGATFSDSLLRMARPGFDEATEAGLAEAVHAGLLRAVEGGSFTFLHDRVQQAAYDLTPAESRRRLHREVGRRLLAELGDQVPEDRLFEVTNHLNAGLAATPDDRERLAVARLNLAAGRKAKMSGAHGAALEYLHHGIQQAGETGWSSDFTTAFGLHLERAECLQLTGQLDLVDAAHEQLLLRARSARDRASVYELRLTYHEKAGRYEAAIAAGRDGLALFSLDLPESAADVDDALLRERLEIDTLLGARSIASLRDGPVMASDDIRSAMRLLTLMWAPVYISGNQPLTSLISAAMVRLSLAHGHTEDSAYGYVTHAMTVGPILRDFQAAYEWGELALAVNERFGDLRRRAKIHQQIHAHVKLWRLPFDTCLVHAREAKRWGLEGGDWTYAGYGAATETWPAVPSHRRLDAFVRDFLPSLDFLARVGLPGFRDTQAILLTWAMTLQGLTGNRRTVSSHLVDESTFVERYSQSAPLFMAILRFARLHLAVLFDDLEAGVDAAHQAWATAIPGTIWPVLDDVWGALALAAAWDTTPDADRPRHLDRIREVSMSLGELAASCPENFRCFSLAVTAELARLEGRLAESVRLLRDAIAYADVTNNVQQRALASELCGRLHLSAGRERDAQSFLEDAYRAYESWGAVAKLEHLESRYGAAALGLTDRRASSVAVPPEQASSDVYSLLDVASVVHVSRAIASEVEHEALVRTLVTIALENAGAARGVFLHVDGDDLVPRIDASVDGSGIAVRHGVDWESIGPLAGRVARYVRRTGQDVIVGEIAADERFGGRSETTARSILCLPVARQGQLRGILYLENGLADTFTPARTEIVRVIAAQTAIALENARLYGDMKNEIHRRVEAERALRAALEEVESLKNRLEAENVYLQEEIRTQHNFEEIIGSAPSLLDALHTLERVAATHSTVLILGETGTGKELFARAVHDRSPRRGRPLVKVNCGAISPGLIESELFGHVKGAFTGAVDRRVGRFELANGGAIFLDEVGELPLDAQVKLLRVLQEQEFESVGSDRTVKVDVRVIAATNRDLQSEVAAGRFRADLYYRLNVLPLKVPPLRERRPDIPLLVSYLAQRHAKRLGRHGVTIAQGTLSRLMAYDWPGNVRELENVIERALVLHQGGPLDIDVGSAVPSFETPMPPPVVVAPHTPAPTMEDMERAHIAAVLEQTRWIVEGPGGAAQRLGLKPSTLRSRMKKLGVARR